MLNAINQSTNVEEKKIEVPPPPPIPGSVAYLATVAHGLSHTQFWEKVEKKLRSSFSSGVNSGYKKK